MQTDDHSTHFGRYRLDRAARTLTRDGVPVPLRPKTLSVLIHLADNAHRVVSKDELLRVVWCGRRIEDQGVFQSISELRAAFDGTSAIRTVRGTGYQWILAPVARRSRRWVPAAAAAALLAALLSVPLVDGGSRGPVPVDALLAQARAELAAGRLAGAEAGLVAVLARNPSHLEARLDLAYLETQRGRRDAARALADEVHGSAVLHGADFLRMASAELLSRLSDGAGDRDDARDYARETVAIARRLDQPVFAASGHERLGALHLAAGDRALAIAAFSAALDGYSGGKCVESEQRVRSLLAGLTHSA